MACSPHNTACLLQEAAIRTYKADCIVVGQPKPAPSSSEGTDDGALSCRQHHQQHRTAAVVQRDCVRTPCAALPASPHACLPHHRLLAADDDLDSAEDASFEEEEEEDEYEEDASQ